MKENELENLLTSAEQLEELYLGNYDISLEDVEIIKAKGKNLKRLRVYRCGSDTIKETLAGFHGTKIHAIAGTRNYIPPAEMNETIKYERGCPTCDFSL